MAPLPEEMKTPKQPLVTERTTCRITGGTMTKVFDLGNPCVSDFLPPGTLGVRAPLAVAVGDKWPHLPQLTHSYSPEAMYRRYHYRSGTNQAMQNELRDVVNAVCRRVPERYVGYPWLDIACNDGTLLMFAQQVWDGELMGFDPSDVADVAHERNDYSYELANDFFSAERYFAQYPYQSAVITCIAMFYDLEDPIGFLKDVEKCLTDDGLFVLQLHYAPMMLDHLAFDAICHEHLTYWNYCQLEHVLLQAGLYITDAEITASNGGSIRLYVMKEKAAHDYEKTIEGMAAAERAFSLSVTSRYRALRSPIEAWGSFAERVKLAKAETLDFLEECRTKGKTVVGYGASTKGNTLLQYFGIGPELLPAIAEAQPHKFGLTTAGSGIPIISESDMRLLKPDFLYVLPWHFASGFSDRESALIASGTRLVLPLPRLRVLGG